MANKEQTMQATYTFDENTLSDLYKDASGHRPSGDWMRAWCAMPDDVKQADWDRMCRDVEASIDEEEAAKQSQYNKWKAHIDQMCADNGISTGRAIRWDMDAMDAKHGGVYDAGYYCYLWGIDYKLSREIKTHFETDSDERIVAS